MTPTTHGSLALPAAPAVRFSRHIRAWQTLALLALGIVAAVTHAAFRFPLHLPGHHGLEWMALLVIARYASPYRWAATVAASGAAAVSILPLLGFHDPLTPLTYLLPGLLLDLFTLPLRTHRAPAALMAVAAALAHTASPLLHAALWLALGWQFGAFSHGLLFPFVTHLAFGFAGGLAGAGLWKMRPARS
jgi:hypothetical protein